MKKTNCIVPTLSALHALQNHVEGECVYCEEDSKIYTWQENDGWRPIEFGEGKGISMNLYDLNQSIVSQLPALTKQDIAARMDVIHNLHNDSMNKHYMLLCKDYNYYTIFECDTMLNMPSFGVAVCDIITDIGEVFSIDATEDKNAIEIWIKPNEENNPFVFYLFPYDSGVVYYG